MTGRTVIMVSHHVQLCTNGAKYVVALDGGRVAFEGDCDQFTGSPVMDSLVQSNKTSHEPGDIEESEQELVDKALVGDEADVEDSTSTHAVSESSETTVQASVADIKPIKERKAPRKWVEEEARAVGRIGLSVWKAYLTACGGKIYWTIFILSLILASLSPVFENGWIRIWTGAIEHGASHTPLWYISIYAAVRFAYVRM